MDTTAPSNALPGRRDVIADDWYKAIAPTAFVPLHAAQVRRCLADLAEQTLALVYTDSPDWNAARGIGMALARLHFVQPESLAATLQVLAHDLIAALPAEQAMILYPRLSRLLSELAAGFSAQTVETLLNEQEKIRQALIADRLRAENALRKSETLYRAVVEDQTELIGRFLPGGTITFANEACCRYFGASRENLIGRNFMLFVLAEDREQVKKHLASLNRENPLATTEVRVVTPNKQIHWLQWTSRAILDEHGRLIEFQVVGRDITEHKQAEEKLQEAEARYRMLVEQIPAITYTAALDEASTTLYVSPQVETILGFSQSDYRANPDIWRERLHPDDREQVMAEVARSHATGEPFLSEYRLLTRDGRVVWIHDEAAPVHDADGQPLFLQGVMLDITCHKQVEEALRQSEETARGLLNATADAAFLIDMTGNILSSNDTIAKRLGKSTDELMGACIYDFLPPDVASRRRVQVDKVIRSSKPAHVTFERGGSWIDSGIYPIFDAQGRVMRIAVYDHDITEQRQMEESLLRHAQEMEALYKTSLEINSQLDVSLLLQAIVQRAAKLIGTQMGGLYLIKPDGQTLEMAVSHNLPVNYLGLTFHLGEGLAGQVAQTGTLIAIDDYIHWEGRAAAYANSSVRRALGVPLKVTGRVIGVIEVADDKAIGPFAEDEIRLVSLFADQAAIALENARLYQAEREQRELAETLRETGATLVSMLDTTRVLDRILEQVSRVTPNDVAYIMLIKGDSAHFAGWRGYERFGVEDLTSVTFPIASTRHLLYMVETGEPVVIHDVHADPDWIDVPGTEQLRSYVGVPIRLRCETIGFLGIHSVTQSCFEWSDAERLRAFADQAAIALENARLFEEARKTAERLQALSYRMVEVQEAERRSIARELHDEIGQTLTAVKINLQALQRLSDASGQASILEDSAAIIERALQQVRNLSLDLRPSLLDDLGLVPALRWYVTRQAERAGFTAVIKAESVEAHLSPDLEIACFRVVQEALTNVTRHARAQHVLVELCRHDTQLELTIRDDGVGFDVQSALEHATHGASLGLLGMEERVTLVGGHMEIESVPMHGTEIHARFPLMLPSPRAEGDCVS